MNAHICTWIAWFACKYWNSDCSWCFRVYLGMAKKPRKLSWYILLRIHALPLLSVSTLSTTPFKVIEVLMDSVATGNPCPPSLNPVDKIAFSFVPGDGSVAPLLLAYREVMAEPGSGGIMTLLTGEFKVLCCIVFFCMTLREISGGLKSSNEFNFSTS